MLPFVDMSPAREQDYFCEGIAEELINALTHVAGLRVLARSLSFQFRSSAADVRAIGARLGVTAVLEGSVRRSGDRLRVTVQLVAEPGWATVVVRDSGIGIPAGDLPHVFEPFRRGTNVVGRINGTGIGLASAKRIVERHGGTLSVDSATDQGSTFTMRVPPMP